MELSVDKGPIVLETLGPQGSHFVAPPRMPQARTFQLGNPRMKGQSPWHRGIPTPRPSARLAASHKAASVLPGSGVTCYDAQGIATDAERVIMGAARHNGIHAVRTLGCQLGLLDSLCSQVTLATPLTEGLSFPSAALVG